MNCTPKVGHHQQKGVQFSMTKYSKEEKIAAIKAVEAGESILQVARQFQINYSVLKWIVRSYREHGEKGLSRQGNNWTGKQKYEILKYMHENQLSCKETGIKFGISGSATVSTWERRYLENGSNGLENKKLGRKPRTQKSKPPKTREEELLDRILYLEVENAYLKKLNALVAEREKREKESK
jgi:transposase